MKRKWRHQAVRESLLEEIFSGKYDNSPRLPSEAELVKRFAVSRPTVARALQELKSQGVLDRRVGSGTYLRKNNASKPKSQQLGLIVPGLGSIEIFEVICGELASLARVHDFGLHWGSPQSGDSMSLEEAECLCERFIEQQLSGVFFAPFEHHSLKESANRRITERLRSAGIPVVLLDRDLCPFPHRSSFDLVGIDNFTGGYLLAEHLIKLGVERIAFISRPLSATTAEVRKAGATAALIAHGIPVPRNFLQAGDPSDMKFVRQLISGQPYDGVICTNDHTAAQLLQTLARLSVKTPDNLRVVGFDDVRFATLLQTPLTTIQQPCRDIALTAFNAMKERVANPTLPPRSLLLNPNLIVRESCGAYLPGEKKSGAFH